MVHSPFFYQNILNIQITTKQIADSNLTTKIKARGDNSTLELMHQTGVKRFGRGVTTIPSPASSMKYAATIPQHASTRAGI